MGQFEGDLMSNDLKEMYEPGECPRCHSVFAPPENPSPHGYLCPECEGSMKGIVHFRKRAALPPKGCKCKQLSDIEWEAIMDALLFTAENSIVSEAHARVMEKLS